MLKIIGKKKISGTVEISGSKNAALPLIAASLLIKGRVKLNNIPKIGDVLTFLEILGSIGIDYKFEGSTLILDTLSINDKNIDLEKIKKIRASILLLAPMLHHFGVINIPFPGGCSIGARPIDSHIFGLERVGYKTTFSSEEININGTQKEGTININAGFGVTSTENLIVANVMRKGETIISLAAIEPHVMNVISFLRKAGANISIRYDHTIVINGVDELSNEVDFDVHHDYIEAGTFMIIGALASEEYIDIKNACISDLYLFIEKIKDAGVKVKDLGNDTLRVFKCDNLKAVNIQTNIFPGFPTDLQSPFAILQSQAEGTSKIFEVLFEGRLSYLVELEKMGGKPSILNPHQAIIEGGIELKGATVTSWDLRAGAAMIIAGLIAEGETRVTKVEYIERGYENFVDKLLSLGADITIIK